MKPGSTPAFIIMLIILCIGLNNETSKDSLLLIALIPSTIFSIVLFILFVLTLCVIVRKCVDKKTLDEDHVNQEPTYEDITQCRKEMPMEENAAYGNIKYYTTAHNHF
jgi:membrane protein implicated in regulation of membrane protease activity